MPTNFDEIIPRRGTSCLKYDFAVERGYPEDVLPFWVADMDFRTAQPIIDDLTRRVQHGIFGYTDPGPDYRAALSRWMTEQHGYTPAAGSLVMTPGVVFALAMAVQSFTAPGDAILIQQPVYYPFGAIIRENDRQLVNCPLALRDGHYEIDFVKFEQCIVKSNVKLFLLCNPHNPVGRVFTREELSTLATICLQHHVLIVADEIHHDFVRPGFRHTTLASLSADIAQHTITCTAPSKTFNLAGLQCSNIFIENPALQQKFRRTIDRAGYSQPNALGLFAAQAAYEKGLPWLTELRAYLEENLARTKEFLARELPRVTLIEPEGTYLLWLDFRAYDLSAKALDDLIVHKAKLWLDSGHIFGADGEGFERLNIACPWQTLKRGLEQLATALRPLA